MLIYLVMALAVINGTMLFAFSANLLVLLFLAFKNDRRCRLDPKRLSAPPMVTIQLPIFNEKYVARRIIDGAAAMDYPKGQLQIQVLDDSTDETLEESRRAVEHYRELGYDIELIHRDKRIGHKGGALREGLTRARGEFVAIFDADFLPSRSILRKITPYFLEDRRLGMVQTRWGHVNPETSALTRAQAVLIDCHFSIDQVARSGSGLFMNFNGTAGIWRRECIEDAGNWQDDTLTEDMDLSYRAKLRGWRMLYIQDIVNKAELPTQISAYKSQQFRWAKGSMQTAMKLLRPVLRSEFPVFRKIQAVLHLAYYLVHPLLLLNMTLAVPFLALRSSLALYDTFFGAVLTLFGIGIAISIVFFIASQAKTNRDWLKRLAWIPAAMTVGAGMAVNNTVAILEALRRKPSEFIRTPKWGITAERGSRGFGEYAKALRGGWIAALELLFGLYAGFGILVAARQELYPAIPFFCLYAFSFVYVFILGRLENHRAWKLRWEEEA